MAIQFDDYVYRISAVSPQHPACTITLPFSMDLPKDLQWTDEIKWGVVDQTVEYSLTGALLIQEGVKQKGRPITLIAADNMAWLTRIEGDTLQSLRNSPGLVMTLKFVHKTNPLLVRFSYNVMFRHAEGGVELENIKNFDQYEDDAWYIVKSLKFMETLPYGV